jgi:hypothetical protein
LEKATPNLHYEPSNMNQPTIPFAQFLAKFPEIELPVVLNDEAHLIFSAENDPLAEAMIAQYILPNEPEEADELTEFVPCFKLPKTEGFDAVVYWRAGLMNYQYVLVTFATKGELLDRRVIAGTFINGPTITQSVATINEENEIFVASGQSNAQDDTFDPASSTAYELELLPDGLIVNN